MKKHNGGTIETPTRVIYATHKRIIKNIVWKEIETLRLKKNLTFEYGKKLFKVMRIK